MNDFDDQPPRQRKPPGSAPESVLERTEAILITSQRLFEFGCWYWDIASNTFDTTDELRRLYENPRDGEPIGYEEAMASVHPEDRAITEQALAKALQDGEPYAHIYRAILPSGEERVFDSRGVVEFGPDGRPKRMIGVAQNITQRVKTEQALRASEELNRRVIEAVPGGIVHVGPNGDVRVANEAAQRLLGLSWEALTSRYVSDFATETLRESGEIMPVDEYPVTQCLRTGQPAGPTTLGVRRPDGEVTWAIFTAVPVRGEAGKPDGAVVTFLDITKRKQTEEALSQAHAQLQQAQKMEAVGRLAGGVAHDFNNLLTVVLGMADVVLNSLEPIDPRREKVELIRQAARRGAETTRQLLTFSRKAPLKAVPVDLNDLLRVNQALLQRLIGATVHITLRLSSEPLTVRVDPGQMLQVVMNLALNARDAMPEGGPVEIATARSYLPGGAPQAPSAVLEVRDRGAGISDEVKARLFEPFFTTKGPGGGTGLGLATVYGVVTQNGGTIEVASTPGVGSTFRVHLPFVEVPAETAAPDAAQDIGFVKARDTILLAEDDELVRVLAKSVMEERGYKVLVGHDGEHALSVAAAFRGKIDLLLTDVVMPKLGGISLAARLQAERPGLKVLFMSGYTDDPQLRLSPLPPGTAFLAKPFEPAELAQRVRDLLGAT